MSVIVADLALAKLSLKAAEYAQRQAMKLQHNGASAYGLG
jgi:hypothetical protein